MKFSIIIAAYNVERTILYTLNSLESQNYNDFEVIIVNDSSNDNTEERIKEFIGKSKLKEITYIKNKINSGLSVVRNSGLNLAKGDYVLFLDGDDAYHSGSLEILRKRIEMYPEAPDAMFFSAATFIDDIELKNEPYNIKNYLNNKGYDRYDFGYDSVVGVEWFKSAFKNGTYFDAAQLIVLNRNFLIKNKLNFRPKLIFEDTLFTREVLLNSNKIGVCNELIILIRKAEGSIMRSPLNGKKIKSRYIISKELLAIRKEYKDNFFYFDSLNMLLINLRAIKKSDQYFIVSMCNWILLYFFAKEALVRALVFDNVKTDIKKLIGYTNDI
jgi:glycosyltransferase involved in cell wall biosynthesis